MPKNVVLHLYLDKGLLNEGDDLLLVGVGGRRKRKEVQMLINNERASSRGGLVVERWSDNRLHSATVGSNLHQVWCINRYPKERKCLEYSTCVTAHTEGPA